MKGGLRFEDSSDDELESDSLPLIYLVPRKKKGSGKKELLEKKKKRKKKKRSRVLLSDADSDKELLVKSFPKVGRKNNGGRASSEAIVEKSSGGPAKRKRKKTSRSKHLKSGEEDEISGDKVEEDEREIKRSRMDVFEYNEDDIVDYKKMKKETETERSKGGGVDGTKRSKVEKKNRGIDVSDKEKSEIAEDRRVRSADKLKEQSKVPRKKRVEVKGESGESPLEKKKVDRPEKTVEHSAAKEKTNSTSAGSYIGKRTRSSVNSQQNLEKPCSPKLTEKSKLPKELPAKKKEKKQQRHLRRVEKETSLQVRSENEDTSMKKKRKKEKATSTTEHVLSSELPEKRMRKLNMEKEEIRDQIREILNSAGWTIDYRPRLSKKDYSDAVYIDLAGSEYWSILKAYYGLEKHWKNKTTDRYASGFSFMPMPTEILDKLTRRTKKKIEREKMMAKRNEKTKGITEKMFAEKKHVKKSKGSSMNKEKLKVLLKQDGKSLTTRMKKKGFKLNRKNRIKRPTSADSSDKLGNGMRNGVPKPPDNAHLPKGRKSRTQRGYTLLVRKPDKEANSVDHFVAYEGSRTVLSWLVNSETISLGGKVKYMNKRHRRALLEGSITRDGIHCGCCNEIVTISEFETHAGSKLRQPCQNIYVETGVPLFQCQIDAWNKQGESERSGFHCIDTTIDDPNDDACGICGDGGDLICCDGCPSTFHQSCLGMQVLPKGDWHCFNCCCKFCGVVGCSDGKGDDPAPSKLLTCSLCEEKYHGSCTPQGDAVPVVLDSLCTSFCGQSCRELFEQLQKLLGVKHEVEAGFSWTLIQRSDLESDSSLCGLPQKVECNSKLALALSVLDECFLPTIDERSGINLIHNVVYNCGSNFKRLDYRGFYTFVLEKGDEVIAAASIRMHGTRFAEMPFIGTRHIYRRQGMCRRLLNAIESSLSSLNVEKLIIPAISELMDTWTTVFGFSHLEESYKNELKSLNMLVFPGVDLLQKLPLQHSSSDATSTDGSVVKAGKPKRENHILLEATNNSETVSVKPDKLASDVTSNEVGNSKMGLQAPGHSVQDTSDANSLSDVPGEITSDAAEETACHNSQSPHESISETNYLLLASEENPTINCSTESNPQASVEGAVDDAQNINLKVDGLDLRSFAETSSLHSSEETSADGSDINAINLKGNNLIPAEATYNSRTDSVEPGNLTSDVTIINYANGVVDEIVAAKTGLQVPASPVLDSSVASNPLDVPGEQESHASKEEIVCHNSQSLHKSLSETNHLLPEAEENSSIHCSTQSNLQASVEGTVDDAQNVNVNMGSAESDIRSSNGFSSISTTEVHSKCLDSHNLEVGTECYNPHSREESSISTTVTKSVQPEVETEPLKNTSGESGPDDCLATSVNGVREVNLITDGVELDLHPSTAISTHDTRVQEVDLSTDGVEPDLHPSTDISTHHTSDVFIEGLEKPTLKEETDCHNSQPQDESMLEAEPESTKNSSAESSAHDVIQGAVNGVQDVNMITNGAESDFHLLADNAAQVTIDVLDKCLDMHSSKEENEFHSSHSRDESTMLEARNEVAVESFVESSGNDSVKGAVNDDQEVNVIIDNDEPDLDPLADISAQHPTKLLNESHDMCLPKVETGGYSSQSLDESSVLANETESILLVVGNKSTMNSSDESVLQACINGAANVAQEVIMKVDGVEPDLQSLTETSAHCTMDVLNASSNTVKNRDMQLPHKVEIDLNASAVMETLSENNDEVDHRENKSESLGDESLSYAPEVVQNSCFTSVECKGHALRPNSCNSSQGDATQASETAHENAVDVVGESLIAFPSGSNLEDSADADLLATHEGEVSLARDSHVLS